MEERKTVRVVAAKWLRLDELNSVDWLPADVKVVEAILRRNNE